MKIQNYYKKSQEGITLLEVLLSIALITAIAAFSIPVYQSFQVKNDLALATSSSVQALRRAQILSQGAEGDSSWGVKMSGGTLILFKGTSYDSRDASYDENYNFGPEITFSGLEEIVYQKFSGFPQSTGEITIYTSAGEEELISINEKGELEY